MKPKDDRAAPREGDPGRHSPEPIRIRQPRKSREGDAHTNHHDTRHTQCKHVLESARQRLGLQPSSPAGASAASSPPGRLHLEPGAHPACAQSWTARTPVCSCSVKAQKQSGIKPGPAEQSHDRAGSGTWGRGTASVPSRHRTRCRALRLRSSGAHSLSPS